MNTKMVYCYDVNGVYIGTSEAQESPLEIGLYLMPANSTEVEPCEYDNAIEFLVFNGIGWDVRPVIIAGTYYDCSNPLLDCVVVEDGRILIEHMPPQFLEKYTNIIPRLHTSHQIFNKEKKQWEIQKSILEDVVSIDWQGDGYAINTNLNMILEGEPVLEVGVGTDLHTILLGWDGLPAIELAKRKEAKMKSLGIEYGESITMRVHNGVDFKFQFSDKTGTELIEIIRKAEGSFDDHIHAIKTQSFFAEEVLGVQKTQHQTEIMNWLWLYLFGEIPELFKKLKQKRDLLSMKIEHAKTPMDVDDIDVTFGMSGVVVDIPEAMRYILSHDTDTVDGAEIVIPDFVKMGIRAVSREVFSEATVDAVSSSIDAVIQGSFLKTIAKETVV